MSESDRASSRARVGFVGILGVILVAVYWPALDGAFVFDDLALLGANECWRGLDRVPAMFGLGEGGACTYRPVRFASFALDYSVGAAMGDGLEPVVFHAGNLIYHLLAVVAVLFLLRRFVSRGAAVWLAALWALHPVNADAVAYISGRRDILSTLLVLLAFLALWSGLGFDQRATRRSRRSLVLIGVLCFALALLTKEMAVTLPALLIWAALCARPVAAGDPRRGVPTKALWLGGLLVLAGAFVVYRGWLMSHSGMQGLWWGGTPTSNFATTLSLYPRYLGLLVWPDRLVGDYFPTTIPLAAGFGDIWALLGGALYLGLVALALLAWSRRWRASALGIGWFLITMLPVSHVLPHHELFAEHYLYLPSIGLLLALAPVVDRLLAVRPPGRALVVGLLGALLLLAAGRTHLRAYAFASEQAFYEEARRQAPDNLRAAHYLGIIYTERGDCDRALPLLIQSSAGLNPGTRIGRDSHVARLLCASRFGRWDGADAVVERLLAWHPKDPDALYWHGRWSLQQGRLDAAIADFDRAVIASDGGFGGAVLYLATVLNHVGRHAEALATLRRHPHDGMGYCRQEALALAGLGGESAAEASERLSVCARRWPGP